MAKRRLHTVSLAEAAVGDRLTNMRALPSPERQSCGVGQGSGGAKRVRATTTRMRHE